MTEEMSTPQNYHLNESSFTGKNTLEVARVIAEVFVNRFACQWGTKEEITNKLLPQGRASTWSNLDKHINLFCKQFYEEYERLSEQIKLIDEIRFIFHDLPQRLDYKPLEAKEDYPTPEEKAGHFVLCSLCWRSVARRPLEKKTPLCHLHDLPSSSAPYRRRARMKIQAETIKLRLIKALPPLWDLRHREYLNDYLKDLCHNPDSLLPHLATYLQALNLPLATSRDILHALEFPIYYDKIPTSIKEAWNFYMEDRSKHFRLNYIKLLTAEAWLQADSERKHGGKRR